MLKMEPIHWACSIGDVDMVECLLENNCDTECENINKERPIHYACLSGYFDIAKCLLEHNCSTECEDISNSRPIHYACIGKHLDIVKCLLEHNCEIECENTEKMKPIHYACRTGSLDIVKCLIENKCDINCEDKNKKRPIHYACDEGHLDIVKCLLKHNCDFECEDIRNSRPIHYACGEGYLDIVKCLLEHNCDIECENTEKMKPIHLACCAGNLDIVKYLLENNCDIECKNHNKLRPIHSACLGGHLNVGEYLLENDCDIECENITKWRPIHYASHKGNLDTVKCLLRYSCFVECENIEVIDPIYVACKSGHFDIVELLLKEPAYKEKEENRKQRMADKMQLTCGPSCGHDFCRESFLSLTYTETDEIGEGGFGVVYRLTESVNNRQFVLKCICIDDTNTEDMKNLENYINICLDCLRHKNVIQYFGAVKRENVLHIFMEYLEGGSLLDYIEDNKPMPRQKIITFTQQILEGVSYLHGKGIIHLDIKPENILLDSDEQVKLMDFGLSLFSKRIPNKISKDLVQMCTDQLPKFSLKETHSVEMQIFEQSKVVYKKIYQSFINDNPANASSDRGTDGYKAPEIRNGEKYKISSDIWSVGATVVQMLTGERPDDRSINEEIQKPDPLNQLVKEMVKENPAERPTAGALLRKEIFDFRGDRPLTFFEGTLNFINNRELYISKN